MTHAMVLRVIPAVLVAVVVATHARGEDLRAIENGAIRVGIDLDLGGSITHLSRLPGGENLINSHDLGRQVQQSYYSGPRPFGTPHPAWADWCWNPIGSGDVYRNPARVLDHRNDGATLYVKTLPMQWALENVPGDCTFETWITLSGPTARVRCRLTNRRTDTTWYPAQDQELPAVYTIGRLHRLVSYTGERPFTGGAIEEFKNAGPPWTSWMATENWAALVGHDGRGLGVIHPGVFTFIGGFHGTPGQGGPHDDPTGYIAPVRQEILDHDIVYEYEYVLALGTIDEIRAVAGALRVTDPRPDDRFDRDRRHWVLADAEDAGFPTGGSWRITARGPDPRLLGPPGRWEAETMPKLWLRAGACRLDRLEVRWSGPDGRFDDARKVDVPLPPDGASHLLECDLAASPAYRGTITRLRIDLVPTGDLGAVELRLESVAYRRDR